MHRWNTTILPQLALYYDESRRKEAPVAVLEELVAKIEAAFGSTCEAVWCNLFEQGNHNIAWHQDQYGENPTLLCIPSRSIISLSSFIPLVVCTAVLCSLERQCLLAKRALWLLETMLRESAT